MECGCEDWSDEVKHDDLADMDYEPPDVCYFCYILFITAETICAVQDGIFEHFSYYIIAVAMKYISLCK